jgi:hypothetical protein
MQVKALPAFNPVAENRVKSRKNLLVSRVYERKREQVGQMREEIWHPEVSRSRVKLRFVIGRVANRATTLSGPPPAPG